MNENVFESKIKPILLYIGTIVASVMAFAYIICVFVLINGFKAEALWNTTIFSLITALIGFCIMQMLKIQGQSFAKNLPENKEIIKEYYSTKTKDKKARSMQFYWITSCLKDIVIKCITLAASSIGIIYIMIEGSGDYNLLLLAAVNLLMFAGFGLISLVKTYDFYNDSHVPYMKEKIEETKQNEIEKQNQKMLELAEVESNKQEDDSVHSDRGDNILDTSMDTSRSSNNYKPLVVDSCFSCNNILGRTIYSGSIITNNIHNVNKKNIRENEKNEGDLKCTIQTQN